MIGKPAKWVIGTVLLLVIAGLTWFWYAGAQSRSAARHDAILTQGIALFDQKDYAGALQELEKIPPDRIENWQVPYYIGSSQMMLKDYEAAAASFDHALQLKPDEAGTLYALGVAWYKLGNLKLSKAYFAQVLVINPNDEQAKGLMDVMSKLDQQSSAPSGETAPEEPDGE